METLRSLAHDFRLAARGLVRQKAWTSVAVLTLALGIGANSALFTIVNAVLLRPLPYRKPDQIVSLSVETKSNDLGVVPSDVYRAWTAGARAFSAMAVMFPDQLIDAEGDAPTLLTGNEVTASYFDVLGVAPEAGRVFTAAEDVKDGPPVIVLSDALWRSRFGGDRAILGKTITIGEKRKIVLGVMPPSFSRTRRAMYWTPAALESADPPGVTFFYQVVARLRGTATIRSATAELATITKRAEATTPVESGPLAEPPPDYVPVVMTLHERLFGSVRPALLILLASVGVLLLIACANVSNLLLARATRRRREFAVRAAMGASRARIARYLLCESLLLCTVGAALGLIAPPLVVGAIVRLSPAAVASVENVRIDGIVLALTTALVVVTSLAFALIPAINATRGDPVTALAGGGARATSSAREHRLRGAIVVGEMATALVLLTGAGLLGRSFVLATTVDPGFRTERLYALRISLPRARYPDDRASLFFKTLLDRVRRVAGVQSAALADLIPLSGVPGSTRTVDADGHALRFEHAGVGPGYFETVGMSPVEGRVFDAASDWSGREVVISESMSRMAFPGRSAVGRALGVGPQAPTIIGVVRDMRQHGLERPTGPLVYRQLLDTGMTSLGSRATLLLRVDGNPAPVAAAFRTILRDMDSRVLPPEPRSMDDIIADAAAPRKFNSLVLGSFAALAAALAAIGLYGVLAYLVTDRTQEIGIRIALGADRRRVLRLVMGQGSAMVGIGVVLGLAGSVAAVRLLRGLVFGVGVYDPTTFVSASVLLGGTALLACYVPARRAARVDPMTALRAE